MTHPPTGGSEPPINHSYSALDLMDLPTPEPIIDGVYNVGEILLIHGSEACFKSVLVMQLAENLCNGTRLLCKWDIPRKWRVGLLETEMHPAGMGERLRAMFPTREVPDNLVFMHGDLLKKWRRSSMDSKFKVITEWVRTNAIEVLILDTVNDFFRGKEDPSAETVAGKFFDELRSLDLIGGAICVRHDRKKGGNTDALTASAIHPNENIRGSAEFKEDPEVLIHLDRKDRRTHEVILDVGKVRYGKEPEPLPLWFDGGNFRLSPLPPIASILADGPLIRQAILDATKTRFNVGNSTTDTMLADNGKWLTETMEGHNKLFSINELMVRDAPWRSYLPEENSKGSVQDTKPFIKTPVPLKSVSSQSISETLKGASTNAGK